jgi:hypothetical protein
MAMNDEAVGSYETSVYFNKTTRRYVPESCAVILIPAAVRTEISQVISNLSNVYPNVLYSLFKLNNGMTVLESFKLSARENREDVMFMPWFKPLENERVICPITNIFVFGFSRPA